MLALPTPAAVAAALAGMGLRLRAGGRVCRFRLQEGMGQADIQVDSDGQNNLLHTVTSFNEFTVKFMPSSTNISIRMDADLKAQADALFAELGMNLSTAFNIFVRQSLREGGIPFEVKLEQPNKETIAAMLEAERIAKDPSVKGYNDLDELFADLKK